MELDNPQFPKNTQPPVHTQTLASSQPPAHAQTSAPTSVSGAPDYPESDSNLRIRDVVKGDIPRLAQLERQLFPQDDPYSEEVIAHELGQPYTWYFVAEQAGEIVGYAGVAFLGPRQARELEIHTIGVDPRRQRQGVGQALMEVIMAAADAQHAPIYLEVRTDNEAAIGLYTACGFVRQGLRKNYYESSGSDAYTMMRSATAPTAQPQPANQPQPVRQESSHDCSRN